ncbi:MAG TPA: hypothetical protein VJQ43_06595 [Thermoplasmata archaeon]|nr:hypothetical protein [Thermoplasmata archaeon]
MPIALHELPKFLVLEPGGGIRLEFHLDSPACEFDVALQNEKPGRSFIVMIGHRAGTIVQRVRLAGRAKILFDPEGPGDYTLVLTNPMAEPAVVRLKTTPVGRRPRLKATLRRSEGGSKSRARRRPKKRAGPSS